MRQHDYEQHPDGLVTVLVPRFTGTLARRLLVPLLRRPHIRMHLDEVGSAVWSAMDGETTVAALGELVRARFGGAAADARQRVDRFLLGLVREGSVAVLAAGDRGVTS